MVARNFIHILILPGFTMISEFFQALISDFLPQMSFPERLRMRRQGRNFWAAYMSTKERALDTAMAVIRQRLGMEPPYFKA